MIEYTGEFASCTVYADQVEESAVKQIYGFLNSPVFEGSTMRIMPDVHMGFGVVIGLTATMTKRVTPACIGVDIGCGVVSYQFTYDKPLDFNALDRYIRERVPLGATVHEDALVKRRLALKHEGMVDGIDGVVRVTEQDEPRVYKSLGTLGGGNHFIELGKVDDASPRRYFLTLHSGSRNFGLKIANFHQKKAKDQLGDRHGLEWLEGEDMNLYFAHMQVAQMYADTNRRLMAEAILPFFGHTEKELAESGGKIHSIHNYIDFTDRVIRKGAISARLGQLLVIPWNMRSGLIIGVGKGNPNWNYSAPHGAGRVMSRTQAKKTLSVDKFVQSMKDAEIWTSSANASTLDEAPEAYKDPEIVKAYLSESVDILYTVRPIYSLKAGE